MNSEISASEVLEDLIRQAEEKSASDIHIQTVDCAAQVSFRRDGMMTPITVLAPEVAERIFGRIKFLARMKTYQDMLPQDGRIEKDDVAARHDIRVSTYPTVTGEKAVLRLFSDSATKTLRQIEFPDEVCAELERFLRKGSGLALLTGPAGSGKTTTIYACLRYLIELGGRQIITVEDPVEQIIPGIMQTEINDARGLTFSEAARHLMRQDPQVLVIGEIRDDQTAGIAVRAALTGHLVISTLHAGSCQGVLERLMVMCPDHHAVVSVIELALNQRLIRRLCPQCGGKRCPSCLRTGYQGRLPLVEWVRMDESRRSQIRIHGPSGMKPKVSIEEAARRLLEKGITSQSECERVIGL